MLTKKIKIIKLKDISSLYRKLKIILERNKHVNNKDNFNSYNKRDSFFEIFLFKKFETLMKSIFLYPSNISQALLMVLMVGQFKRGLRL